VLDFPLNKVILLGGAGLSIHFYEEEWETVAMSFLEGERRPVTPEVASSSLVGPAILKPGFPHMNRRFPLFSV